MCLDVVCPPPNSVPVRVEAKSAVFTPAANAAGTPLMMPLRVAVDVVVLGRTSCDARPLVRLGLLTVFHATEHQSRE